jgi:hypothetical protein
MGEPLHPRYPDPRDAEIERLTHLVDHNSRAANIAARRADIAETQVAQLRAALLEATSTKAGSHPGSPYAALASAPADAPRLPVSAGDLRARDLAIAEAVRDAFINVCFSHSIPMRLRMELRAIDLAAVIASVKL